MCRTRKRCVDARAGQQSKGVWRFFMRNHALQSSRAGDETFKVAGDETFKVEIPVKQFGDL